MGFWAAINSGLCVNIFSEVGQGRRKKISGRRRKRKGKTDAIPNP